MADNVVQYGSLPLASAARVARALDATGAIPTATSRAGARWPRRPKTGASLPTPPNPDTVRLLRKILSQGRCQVRTKGQLTCVKRIGMGFRNS